MKIRKGFVSNSSSSSFVCDICGREDSGWDMGLRDAEMFECVNGHIFCEEHTEEMPLEEKQKMALKWIEEDGEDNEDIVNGVTNGEKDWIESTYDEYFEEKDLRYDYPADLCPCCNLSNPTDRDLIKGALLELGMDRDGLEKMIREKYGTCSNLKKAWANK